jgi:hypothetical protein
MMRTVFLYFLIVSFAANSYSQKTLSEQLWDQVQDCYNKFEDMDDDGKPDYDAVDDSRNGYLKISGSWPACGCGCATTVAAFKNLQREYTFLKKEESNCSWKHLISSNQPMKDILPENFGIRSFIPEADIPDVEKAIFYYDMDIPQYGTDTKISIGLIPFGLVMKSKRVLVNGYQQISDDQNFDIISPLQKLGEQIQDDQVLFDIANAEFGKLSDIDQKLIAEIIEQSPHLQTDADVSIYLNEIYTAYKLYLSIQHKRLILGWDKSKSRFYIKSKGAEVELITFKQFIEDAVFWEPVC